MTDSAANIRVNVDPANPGQFFACCGLLELADRLWPGAEGWFEEENTSFCVSSPRGNGEFAELIDRLAQVGLLGELSPELAYERKQLEDKNRQLKREKKTLPNNEEQRRKELGKLLREGMIGIGDPFILRLDWWQDDDDSNPKTWAGSQQVLRIAQAALVDARQAFKKDQPFDFMCVMRPVPDQPEDEEPSNGKRRGKTKAKKDKAEPFYFDSRHGANALPLDIGFSPNELGMESKAFPAVELLCLIGLQRCRPSPTDRPLVFEYFPWSNPLPIAVVPAALCGLLGQRVGYRFEDAYRTDQRKHKGYLPAIPFTR
jgi:hypothetical protein